MITHDVGSLQAPRSKDRVAIIGAGAIGLYLAMILNERGRPVVVIEAGERRATEFESAAYESVGRKHHGIRGGRVKGLGGTSNLWGGQLVGFREEDLDLRDWLPGSGWPIPFAQLRGHYRETFERLGIPDSHQSDEPVWEQAIGRVPTLGPGVQLFLTRWMRVPNLAELYGSALDRSSSLHVLLGHQATGFRGHGRRIDAVRVRTPGGQDAYIDAGTVVVAAGTIETSRLLLVAAADRAWDCPWRGLAMLGRRFHDHLGASVGEVVPRSRRALDDLFSTMHVKGLKFQPKFRLSSSHRAATETLGVTGMLDFESPASDDLIALKRYLWRARYSGRLEGTREILERSAASAPHIPRLAWTYFRRHRVVAPIDARIRLLIQAEQSPLPDSRIVIDPSVTDASGVPRAVLDWRIGDLELRSIREFILTAERVFSSSGIGELRADERFLALDPAVLDELRDTNHPSGGCVMGATQSEGVVDTDMRVFGTDNTFVAGAAVFPTSSDANVTFTAMAFATRLAHHIAGSATEA